MNTLRWVLILLAVATMSACASNQRGVSCHEKSLDRVSIVFERKVQKTFNGVSSQIGVFRLINGTSKPLGLTGWRDTEGFFLEYPTAQLQRFDGDWVEVVPLLGSFSSFGDHEMQLRAGESALIFARVDFGIGQGPHKLRLLVTTANGGCAVSAPFDVNV